MKIRIEITKGTNSGREFELNSNEQLIIGRGGDSEIQMTDLLISREHCEVKCDGMQLLLRDLGSTNKTFLVQGGKIEPVEPGKYYQIIHGASFFAGPESRFTATYLPSVPSQAQVAETHIAEPPDTPNASPAGSRGSSSGGNFSNSIEIQPGSEWGQSSIFNLLGDFPQNAKSLDTDINSNAHSSEPRKPDPAPPASPQFQDAEVYDSGSIAAPQNQGGIGRAQVFEQAPHDTPGHRQTMPEPPIHEPPIQEHPSGNKGSSAFSMSIETQADSSPQAPDREYASPPSPPASTDQPEYSSFEDASIAPPHLQGIGEMREQAGNVHDHPTLKSAKPTPKVDDPQGRRPDSESVPPAVDEADSHGAFSSSVVHSKSIAAPGQVYEMRKPRVPTNPPPSASAFDASVAPVVPTPIEQVVVPADELPVPESDTRQPKSAQPNGLHFHTGEDLAQLDGLIAELGQKMKPLYCVDFSRLEIEPPTQEPIAKSIPQEQADDGPSPSKGNESAFDIEDEAETETQPAGETQAEPAKLIGTPLFDFLPEGHQQNGPMLLAQPELNFSLSDAWEQDAMVVFFGPAPEAITAHLKKLLHTNIQTGKKFKGMFGFCWPSVLHTLFESQGEDQVKRVFGEAVSHVLLEDPQQRHAWNLVALSDQANSLQSLENDR